MARAGGGSVVNVSSAAALIPVDGLMAYGMSKLALEHLTLDAARELHPQGTNVNCFRIDVPVASEGFLANAPGADHDTWSAGSFFTNPILSAEQAAALPADAPRYPAGDQVKSSAAWLIEHAGFHKGYGTPPATLSTNPRTSMGRTGPEPSPSSPGSGRRARPQISARRSLFRPLSKSSAVASSQSL